jgi:hypothetical protein
MECINATSLRRKSEQWGLVMAHLRGSKNVGCPIQAVLWLEWETTALQVHVFYGRLKADIGD